MNTKQVEALLATYPRPRPNLPPSHEESYVAHYRSNRAGRKGLPKAVAKLESWMHYRVADGISSGNLLEIGAGNLNHVPYLPRTCVCDAIEPFADLVKDSPFRSRIRHLYSDIQDIPKGAVYDCIFSVAVLEHLTDLPFTLARSARLLRKEGTFRAGFPSEGGLLWGLGWRLTTGIEYRLRRGLDYGAIMRHEHVNNAAEILMLLRHFFGCVEVFRFPCELHHLSFYTTAIATKPSLDRCHEFDALRAESRVQSHE